MANWQSGGPKKGHTARWNAKIGRIGVVSQHSRSLLSAMTLTVLHIFVRGLEYLDGLH